GPYALSWKPCQGDSLNLPDHSLVPAKSNSYFQAFNVKSLFGEIVTPKKSQVKLKGQIKIYVYDIIFGATNKDLCKSFEKLMKDKFQMSSMGELTFFLGLQVKQKKDGIFISQDKYVAEIGSLMYLTSSRPDNKFASWLVQKQTALGKDKSNLLIVDSLLKTIWSSIHHLLINEVLTIPGKTTSGFNTPRSDEDRLELMELMVFLLPKVEKVGIGVNAVDLQVFVVRHELLLFSLTNCCYSLSAVRLQALVDKKKVVVTEAAIREALHLDDAKGVDCLPNKEIFCRCMSAKRTSWNEFRSSMASAVICLSLRRKFNFSKIGTGFSGAETHLFEGMLVEQEVNEEGDVDEHVKEVNTGDVAHGDVSVAHGEVPTVTQEPSIPSPTPSTPPLQPPQDLPSTSQVQQTPPQSPQVQPPSPQPQPQPQPQQAADFPMSLLQEAMDACAALTRRVEHLEYDKVSQGLEITKLRKRVKKLEKKNKGRMIAEMDQDDDVVLENDKKEDKEVADAVKDVEEAKKDETEPAKVQEVVDVVTSAKLITEVVTAASAIITTAEAQVPTTTLIVASARVAAALKLHVELNKDIDWDEAIDHVKRKAKEDPATKEHIEEDENRALQKLNKTPADRAAKRRKLDEEVEELRRHLQIVPNEDDDVYNEATPLARKVSVVDYQKTQRNEHGPAKIKGWKLLESCGMQIITFTSTQLILLVEMKYPLTRFTLDQMLNAVRLEVEEESEVSLEMLRFTRQQHQEGQLE
nr:hypothetical protein [Tanacetum cinerariifolium]